MSLTKEIFLTMKYFLKKKYQSRLNELIIKMLAMQDFLSKWFVLKEEHRILKMQKHF